MTVPPPTPPRPPAIRADLWNRAALARAARSRVVVAVAVGALLVLVLVGLWVWRLAFAELPPIPDKAALWSLNRPPGATFLDYQGQLIGQRGPRHGPPVPLKAMPKYLPQAFLAAEDRRFYHHGGVDLSSVLRALKADLGAHRVVQGGSTITQQVARNIFLTPEQSLRRKLQEAALALRIEGMMSKDEILELYLNRIYFGGGAYGVEAAAQTYFGKPAGKLSLAEAALLAALPKAPTRLDPANDLAAAIGRSRHVLSAMQKEGWISPADVAYALAHPPVLAEEASTEGDFGYVLDLAAKEAKTLLAHPPPDLVVRLAVDPRLQTEAARAVRAGVAQFSARGASEAALVALAPDGGVRALVGGLDHRDSPFDRATQAKRQPGSAFKPFVYAAALEAGLAPDDVRPDAPVRIGDYAPTNSDGLYIGNVTLAEALARSINTVAVRVTSEIGVERVAELARRFGLKDIPAHPDLPIALGAYETTLLDLTSAYQVVQNGGGRVQPYLIESIANARGDILYRRNPRPAEAVYDERRAATLTQMLRGVIEAPYGTGRRAALDRPAAGKTGTSQNYRDAWFVGFTPDWVCGVWMGDDRGRPMKGVAGGEGPAQVWRQFMLAAHEGLPPRAFDRAVAKADPRDAFYAGLAEEFERDARTGRP